MERGSCASVPRQIRRRRRWGFRRPRPHSLRSGRKTGPVAIKHSRKLAQIKSRKVFFLSKHLILSRHYFFNARITNRMGGPTDRLRRVPSSEGGGGAGGRSGTEETGPSQAGGTGARNGRGPERLAGMEGVARRIREPLPSRAGRHDRAIVALLRQGTRLRRAAEAMTPRLSPTQCAVPPSGAFSASRQRVASFLRLSQRPRTVR
jgi:hypothetical protein